MLRARGLPVPPNIIIQADNTCREQRNQFLCLWAAQLVSSGVFKSIGFAYFRTGHTHNQVDARFAQMVHHLRKAQVVETPKDFAREINNRVPPADGRKMTVDVLPATWAFQPWLADLEMSYSGITITAQDKSVNHAFRIIRREDLKHYDGSNQWVVDQDWVTKRYPIIISEV